MQEDLTLVVRQVSLELYSRHRGDGGTMQWIKWKDLLVLSFKLVEENPTASKPLDICAMIKQLVHELFEKNTTKD